MLQVELEDVIRDVRIVANSLQADDSPTRPTAIKAAMLDYAVQQLSGPTEADQRWAAENF